MSSQVRRSNRKGRGEKKDPDYYYEDDLKKLAKRKRLTKNNTASKMSNKERQARFCRNGRESLPENQSTSAGEPSTANVSSMESLTRTVITATAPNTLPENSNENVAPVINNTTASSVIANREVVHNNTVIETQQVNANEGNNSEITIPSDPTLTAYEKLIRRGPTTICVCCAGLWFIDQTVTISKRKLLGQNRHPDFMNAVYSVSHTNDPERFCKNCARLVEKNEIPKLCIANGLEFPHIPDNISRLNRIEERLISARHVFQSIFTVGGLRGQYRSKGAIVNVPVPVNNTVESIPRPRDDTNIIEVKLTRRLQQNNNYMEGNINPSYVWSAAETLQNTEVYKKHNIHLNSTWVEDNTNNDDNDVAIEPSTTNTVEGTDSTMELNPGDRNGMVDDHVDVDNEANSPNSSRAAEETNAVVETSNNDTIEDGGLNEGVPETLLAGEVLRMAPGEGSRPISLLMDSDVESLAFPTIFGGKVISPRINGRALSYANIVKSWVRNYDRRAVRRNDFLLFIDRKRQLQSLSNRVTTFMRMSKSRRDNPLRVSNILDGDVLTSMVNRDEAFQVLDTVRSSPAYWKKEQTNVMAMVRQLGVPTLFITLSAAETKWPELLVILKKVLDNEDITEEEAENLSYDEKAKLIQADPVTCARYFDHRVRALKSTWKPPHGPFGNYKIKDSYFRVEYQFRGSPHLHMLLWLENAPLWKKMNTADSAQDDEQQVLDFIDSIVTCSINDVDQNLVDLVLSRQVHDHTRTCKKKNKSNTKKCRFNIPFFPMDKTCILQPCPNAEKKYKDLATKIGDYLDANGSTLHKTSSMTFNEFLALFNINKSEYMMAIRTTLKTEKVYLKRQVSEVFINNYNTRILKMHRANMDIQFILDPYACCSYVVQYINKSDRGMSEHLCSVLNNTMRNNPSTKNVLKTLASAYYNISETSSQEAAYNVLQLRMVQASSQTEFIIAGRPETRQRILKPKAELEKLDADAINIYISGPIDYYAARPESMVDLNLAQFIAYYDYSKKERGKERNVNIHDEEDIIEDNEEYHEDDDGDINIEHHPVETPNSNNNISQSGSIKLNNNLGFVTRRKKSKIIRYYLPNPDVDADTYFYNLAMLFLPWRNQTTELDDVSNERKVEENKDLVLSNKAEFSQIDDQTLREFISQAERDADENETDQVNGENDENGDRSFEINPFHAANRRDLHRNDPSDDVHTMVIDSSDELNVNGDELETTGTVLGRRESNVEDQGQRVVEEEHDTVTAFSERYIKPNVLSNDQFKEHIATLNGQQRALYTHVMDHVRHNDSQQLKLFISGGAGSGKTHLIKALYQSLIRHYDIDRDRDFSSVSVILAAPTGKAAYNISGQTLHSAFKLPINRKKMSELSNDIANTMAASLSQLQVVIIDELSMVSQRMFLWIDQRLQQIFNNSDSFGGKHVIFFGDFFQLPPVHGYPIYSKKPETDTSSGEGVIESDVAEFEDTDDAMYMLRCEDIWSGFKGHNLTEIMRQRDDVPFTISLNNMARGTMTIDDINLFKRRTFPSLPAEVRRQSSENINSKNIFRLFSTNRAVDHCNNEVLNSLNTETYDSECFDKISGSGNALERITLMQNVKKIKKASDTGGLSLSLRLKVDARYMISTNLDTQDGLVNGTTGVLKLIEYGYYQPTSSTEQRKKAIRVWFLLDDEKSGLKTRTNYFQQSTHNESSSSEINREWTPIDPITRVVERKNSLQASRTQFPFVIAEAITIHKSQGSTYEKVCIDTTSDTKKLSRSLLYVACSRATNAAGLYIISNKFEPTKSPSKTSSLAIEMERQKTTTLEPTFTHLQEKTSGYYRVMFHNIQSFNANQAQIKNDNVYLSSDYLLFAETWTNADYITSLNGLTQVSRVDVEEETPKPYGSLCFVNNTILLSHNIQSNFQKLYKDNANHKMTAAGFKIHDTFIASIYISPHFDIEVALEALKEIMTIEAPYKIIAGDFNNDFSAQDNRIAHLFHDHDLHSALNDTITSTTKQKTFIDNIFSNIDPFKSGRYISLTSYHDPLYMTFKY